MITGAHFLFYSKDPEPDRAFFRDILGFRAVDVGHGWLIFARPRTEVAIHPGSGDFVEPQGDHPMFGAVLDLMCDDLASFIKSMDAKNVECSPVTKERWGIKTTMRVPSGGEIGVYQPTHPTALERA